MSIMREIKQEEEYVICRACGIVIRATTKQTLMKEEVVTLSLCSDCCVADVVAAVSPAKLDDIDLQPEY